MRRFDDSWVRIAVVRRHDTSDPRPPLWRFFIGRKDPDIHVRAWTMEGEAVPGVNHVPVASADYAQGDPGIEGLKAAIDIYGDITIDDDLTARIVLKNPA